MSRKHFSILAVTLLVVVAAIFLLLPQRTGHDTVEGDAAVLPGLEARVNDVDRVTVVTAGESVSATLVRDEDGWRVEQLEGYPADLGVLRDVLAGLAQARVLEAKTANPVYYARLGVEDVAAEDAGGVRLDLSAGDGTEWSVIVGDEAANRGGHYLRLPGVAGSVLADFEADVPTDPAGWTDTKVIDLMAGEVAEVSLRHPDGETVTARKVSADETDFSLAELPDGRETKSAWAVNSLGSALSTLDMESVRPADGLDWADAIELRAVRFDGLEVTAWLLRGADENDGDWLRLEAAAPFAEADGEENPAVTEAAAEINARVAGWAYRIPGYKADAMDKRPYFSTTAPIGTFEYGSFWNDAHV